MATRLQSFFSRPPQAELGLLLLAGIFLALYGVSRLAASSPTPPRSCEAVIPELRRLTSDPARLAKVLNRSVSRVSAGEFWMGSDTGRDDERPRHRVTLDSFEIDCFEVTNAQFAPYLQATARLAPPYWTGLDYPAGQADVPVVGVSWEDANGFCAWIGKRLPTEAEWEKAARGLDGRTYPWGEAWDPAHANVFTPGGAKDAMSSVPAAEYSWNKAWDYLRKPPTSPDLPSLKPVGSYPQGQSPFGLMDMAGNASELTADYYNWGDYSDLPARNPRVTEPEWDHVVRGSAWFDPVGNAEWARLMSRTTARSSSHVSYDQRLGFRCARSVMDGTAAPAPALTATTPPTVTVELMLPGSLQAQSDRQAPNPLPTVELEPYFQGYTGTFVLCDLEGSRCTRYNPARAAERFLPASTFKIVGALIGLETGAVPDENTVIPWDGALYPVPAWNRDHTLKSAMRASVVWFYREVARRVGRERMQSSLDAAGYGNRDTSGPDDAFWLTGNLKISADEQVALLQRLFRDELPFSRRSQQIVKEILVLEQRGARRLSGKTGSGQVGVLNLGWFVGYVETPGGVHFFAANIEGTGEEIDGIKAKEIALAILGGLGVWPGE